MKRVYIYIGVGIVVLLSIVLAILIYLYIQKQEKEEIEAEKKTDAIMLMIEFEGTEGLVNFVNDLKDRDIPGLLIVSATFVEENCDAINLLLDYHDMEIAGLDPAQALWDVSYEDQLSVITDTKERIFECTGKEIRVFGSKYFAYDENTVKAAQENGIEYVLARGTTGAKATIYKPSEYDVKIFSVSNVDSKNWGTGSLCDYSYWAREGLAEDFEEELFGALKYKKISPVSHTYIGGLKKSWNDVYLKFFDESDINWLDLDSFGQIDISSSFADIPTNREVQYETPHPAVPLDEETDIENPCVIDDIEKEEGAQSSDLEAQIVIFHNNKGAMCIEALAYFESMDYEYFEYVNTQKDFVSKYNSYTSEFDSSEGVSNSFDYFPIIFVGDRVFSGFNDDIKKEIDNILSK